MMESNIASKFLFVSPSLQSQPGPSQTRRKNIAHALRQAHRQMREKRTRDYLASQGVNKAGGCGPSLSEKNAHASGASSTFQSGEATKVPKSYRGADEESIEQRSTDPIAADGSSSRGLLQLTDSSRNARNIQRRDSDHLHDHRPVRGGKLHGLA